MLSYFKNPFSQNLGKLLLYTLWPFLSFYAHNVTQLPSLLTLASLWGVMISILLVILIPFAIFKKNSFRQVTDIFAIALVIIFQFSLIKDLLADTAISYRIVWLMIFVASLILIYKLSKHKETSKVLTIMGAILILMPVGQILIYMAFPNSPVKSFSKISSKAIKKRSNVYYILLDGYGRTDLLKRLYSFDNSPFISALESIGFYIAKEARSNYPRTYLSLSSTLQMDHMLPEGKFNINQEKTWNPGRKPFYNVIQGDNRLVDFFKYNNYHYAHFENKLWDGSDCGQKVDTCINGNIEGMGNSISINETAANLLILTPFLGIISKFKNFKLNIKASKSGELDMTRSGLEKVNNFIDGFNFNSSSSLFLFAHMLTPHPPSRYNSECKYGNIGNEKMLTKWETKSYLQQLKCVNLDIKKLVNNIIEKDKSDPIIVIQSDHGPAIQNQMYKEYSKWTRDDFEERYFILNSLLLPEECRNQLYLKLSPINNFRIVISCLAGAKLELLQDDSYFAIYRDWPDYGKIELKKVEFDN